jgi:hypothetical protein
MTTNFFSSLSFHCCFGSGIRDPGWVKIRIRDKHPGSATLLPFIVISIVYTRHFMLCCGSGMFIPDLEFFASRICNTGSCNKQKGGGIVVLPFCGLKWKKFLIDLVLTGSAKILS